MSYVPQQPTDSKAEAIQYQPAPLAPFFGSQMASFSLPPTTPLPFFMPQPLPFPPVLPQLFMQLQVTQLQTQLTQATNQNQELENQNQELATHLQMKIQENHELEARLREEMDAENKRIREETKRLREGQKELEDRRNELKQKQLRIDSLSEKNDALKRERSTNQSRADSLENFIKEIPYDVHEFPIYKKCKPLYEELLKLDTSKEGDGVADWQQIHLQRLLREFEEFEKKQRSLPKKWEVTARDILSGSLHSQKRKIDEVTPDDRPRKKTGPHSHFTPLKKERKED